jgi:tyrosinase
MLIPKGTPQGLQSELFVMVSDYEQDRVNQDLAGTCNDAAVYCGIRDRLYPDRKAMGYPFDRNSRQGVSNLSTFLTPNMKTQDVSIVFNERTIPRN